MNNLKIFQYIDDIQKHAISASEDTYYAHCTEIYSIATELRELLKRKLK